MLPPFPTGPPAYHREIHSSTNARHAVLQASTSTKYPLLQCWKLGRTFVRYCRRARCEDETKLEAGPFGADDNTYEARFSIIPPGEELAISRLLSQFKKLP